MIERDRLFLNHIQDAITEIENYTSDGRDAFMSDRKTQSAAIRQLEIVGEAVKNLSTALVAGEPAVPWRQIAGMRDRLIHVYFKVDLDAVWSVIEQNLPQLRADVRRLLDGT